MKASEFPGCDGLVLAGGQSRRMGSDKSQLLINNKTLLLHQLKMMQPCVEQLMLAGGDGELSLQRIPETLVDKLVYVPDYCDEVYQGPLSGIAAGLKNAHQPLLWVMSCDNFGFNAGLLELLYSKLDKTHDIAWLRADGREQPLMALMRTNLLSSLQAFLDRGDRSVLQWYRQQSGFIVDYSLLQGQMCNINTPEDYKGLLQAMDSM